MTRLASGNPLASLKGLQGREGNRDLGARLARSEARLVDHNPLYTSHLLLPRLARRCRLPDDLLLLLLLTSWWALLDHLLASHLQQLPGGSPHDLTLLALLLLSLLGPLRPCH